jgi:hypothetical protein
MAVNDLEMEPISNNVSGVTGCCVCMLAKP